MIHPNASALLNLMVEIYKVVDGQCKERWTAVAATTRGGEAQAEKFGRYAAKTEWRRLWHGCADHGLVGRKVKGSQKIVVQIDRPIRFNAAYILAVPDRSAASSGADKPFNGESAPEYETVARALRPTEAAALTELATDRRHWLGVKYPPQAAESGFYVVPLAIPPAMLERNQILGAPEFVAVACEAVYRRKGGQEFQALYLYEGARTEDEALDAAWTWANQWGDRLAADEERALGGRPELPDLALVEQMDLRPERDAAWHQAQAERRKGYAKSNLGKPGDFTAMDRWLARAGTSKRRPDTSKVVVRDLGGKVKRVEIDRLTFEETDGK